MSYSEEQYLKNTRDSFQAGRVVGVDEERERIIKLLEESHRIGIFIPQGVVHTCDKATDPNSVCSCWQIALIQKKANN